MSVEKFPRGGSILINAEPERAADLVAALVKHGVPFTLHYDGERAALTPSGGFDPEAFMRALAKVGGEFGFPSST